MVHPHPVLWYDRQKLIRAWLVFLPNSLWDDGQKNMCNGGQSFRVFLQFFRRPLTCWGSRGVAIRVRKYCRLTKSRSVTLARDDTSMITCSTDVLWWTSVGEKRNEEKKRKAPVGMVKQPPPSLTIIITVRKCPDILKMSWNVPILVLRISSPETGWQPTQLSVIFINSTTTTIFTFIFITTTTTIYHYHHHNHHDHLSLSSSQPPWPSVTFIITTTMTILVGQQHPQLHTTIDALQKDYVTSARNLKPSQNGTPLTQIVKQNVRTYNRNVQLLCRQYQNNVYQGCMFGSHFVGSYYWELFVWISYPIWESRG